MYIADQIELVLVRFGLIKRCCAHKNLNTIHKVAFEKFFQCISVSAFVIPTSKDSARNQSCTVLDFTDAKNVF